MQQLPLDVQLDDYAVFDTWLAGDNGQLLHALGQLASHRQSAQCWIYGRAGAGRSHLLQACVHEADRHGFRAAYLPLGAGAGLIPDMISDIGAVDVVAFDDVDAVAGQASWEQALFGCYERLRQRDARLLFSAAESPTHSGFGLPDLASRFAAGTTFRIQPLSDDEKISALQLRARWRGLDMPDDVARYLFSRIERGNRTLFGVLDRLDRRALAEQRRLTIPFVRDFLAG